MGLLGKPSGIFSLQESDKFVGSFISKEDVKTILEVSDNDLQDVPFKNINGVPYISESSLRKNYWEKGLIPNAVPCKIGNSTISLDEYILISLIKDSYPKAKVQSQYKWGRKYIDIYVEDTERKYFVEFHGPGHFKKMNGYKDPGNPFVRKKQIEDFYGIPCYIWPYWIQRCVSNLKIMLGDTPNQKGFGALWSTKVFFGEFLFDNSAQIICDISAQFNAMPDGTCGYFYEEWDGSNGRFKEPHSIVKKILDGKASVDVLIPKGINHGDESRWLPASLSSLIP